MHCLTIRCLPSMIMVVIFSYFAFYTNIHLLQESIRRCVCIVYDPSRSSQGVLALKALKLTDSFMDLYRNNGLTGEKYDLFSVALSIVLVCTNGF